MSDRGGVMSVRGLRRFGLSLAALLLALSIQAVSVGSASATLPGKNGSILVSTYLKGKSPEDSYRQAAYSISTTGRSSRILGGKDSFYDAAVSPNGKQIAYGKDPGGRLWLGALSRPARATAITRQKEGSSSRDPVFAPDGKSLYFLAVEEEESTLRRYFLKTGKTRSYKSGAARDWGLSDVSPDGRLIVFSRGDEHDSKLMLMQTSSGKARAFKFPHAAREGSFSPDGRRITFVADMEKSQQVFVARLDGKGLRRLTRGSIDKSHSFFSPDGRNVAFIQGSGADRKIGIVTLKTGKTRYLDPPGDYTAIKQWVRKR